MLGFILFIFKCNLKFLQKKKYIFFISIKIIFTFFYIIICISIDEYEVRCKGVRASSKELLINVYNIFIEIVFLIFSISI